jgi:CheY-like chemotaxis protein
MPRGNKAMAERVLLVDDEPRILQAYTARLRDRFRIETAPSGPQALERMETTGPYAVVLADMLMPGMDGIELLAEVRRRYSDTVRMILTGNAELHTAIQAVNEGHVFRFLTKPCDAHVLGEALQAGLEMHRLITAEKVLLGQTLRGSIRVLIDMLALAHPAAFSRTARVQRYVRHVTARLNLPEPWRLELAAMLSQIGCMAVPPETLEKIYAGQELTAEERHQYESHPEVASAMLANIPRLEEVAAIIARQNAPGRKTARGGKAAEPPAVARGARVLRVAIGFDERIVRGMAPDEAVADLCTQPGLYDPRIASTLADFSAEPGHVETRSVKLADLDVGMVFADDVHAKNGRLLVARGMEVTFPLRVNLMRWSQRVGVQEPIRVYVPLAA